MSRKLRLAVLVSHPIQYFVPLFRLLAKREDLDFIVFYHTRVGTVAYRDEGFGRDIQWDIPLLEGYPHRFLSDRPENGGCQWGIVRALLHERPDVLVVHGYTSPTNLLAMLLARMLGVRTLMRGDTRIQKGHSSTLRRWLKRAILSLCDGAIAVGSANRDYYLSLGVNAEGVFFAPFSVDNAAFALPILEQEIHRLGLRSELGVPEEALLVLFASKLIRRKRASDLIDAFARVRGQHPRSHLVIVGSGAEEATLRHLASEKGNGCVHFLGFQNQSELPRTFAACDLFVLPSDNEPWGLVVNEAMASGLPVIVSDDVGAAQDLVANTGAGMVYPCGDIDALAACLEGMLGEEGPRRKMAVRSRDVIQSWDITCTADAIAAAAHQVLSGHRDHQAGR